MFLPRLARVWVIGLWLVGAVGFCAQQPAISDVKVGIAGHFKRGHWAEIQAVIQAGQSELSGDLEVLSHDGDGAAVAFVCPQPVKLTPGQSVTRTTLVKMGPPRSGLRLRVRQGSQILVEHELADAALSGEWNSNGKTWAKAHRSTALVLATLGPAAGTGSAAELLRRHHADEVVEVPLAEAASLPSSWQAYDAIDCLVIVASQDNPLALATPAQRETLLQWLRFGGRALLVAGDGASPLFAAGSVWSPLVPGKVTGREPLATDAGLRTFTGEGLEFATPLQFWKIDVPPQYVALAEGGTASTDRSLIVDFPLGLGSVSLILLDLSQPPLHDWRGRGRLLARLIAGDQLTAEPQDVPRGGRMTHLGYRDLAGQLRMSLDQYEGVAPIHFYPVAGALLIYLLLLGPGMYFLLNRTSPRIRWLEWVVLPLLVVGFTGGAVALGRASHGATVKVNQVEIVDLHPTIGTQSGTFWTGLFTPQAATLSLAARPRNFSQDIQVTDWHFAWQALPGEGLGGADVAPLATGTSEPYLVRAGDAAQPAAVEQLPLARASSKMLAGSWQGAIPVAANVSQLRRGKSRAIEGTFRNIAPTKLKNAYLVYGELMYRARNEIAPGMSVDLSQLESPKFLEYQLTRRSVLKNTDSSPWNQEDADIPRILEMMMFHTAVHGRSYTVLTHRYQPELDLTHLIRSGYAVLVGRAETPLIELSSSGEGLDEANLRRWTYYRIVYPVADAEAGPGL